MDVLPFVLQEEREAYGNEIGILLKKLSEYNINFASFLYDHNAKGKNRKIADLIDTSLHSGIWFNYHGKVEQSRLDGINTLKKPAMPEAENNHANQIFGLGYFMQRFFSYLILQGILIAGWAYASISPIQGISDWMIVFIYSELVFLLGGLQMFVQIPLYTYFQFRIHKSYRGKVWGIANAMTDIAAPFGLWIYGFILEGVQWFWVPLVTGVLVVMICLYLQWTKGSGSRIARELKEPLQQGG